MKHDDKRIVRKLKRDVKRDGNKKRRNYFKKQLRAEPAQAHEAKFEFGRASSQSMNGMDRPADGLSP